MTANYSKHGCEDLQLEPCTLRPPISRTSRIVTNATLEEQADDTHIVRSKFQMIEYRRDKQRIFGGTQWHALEKARDGFLLKWKKVELVNCDSMMDGLTIPF